MFGLGRKKAKVRDSAQDVASKRGTRLLIAVHPGGYQVQLGGGKPPLEGQIENSDEDLVFRLESSLQAAISAIPARSLKAADHLSVVLEGIASQYLDARQSNLGAATAERRRDYGERLLGGRSASFGSMPLTEEDQKRGRAGVFSFVEQAVLQRLLAAAGEHCTKLDQLTPVAGLVLSRSRQTSMNAYGGLYFGHSQSSLVLTNHDTGILVVRQIPLGLHSLVSAVAEKTGMSEGDLLSGFAKRNYFQDLEQEERLKGASTTATSVSLGPIEDALRPVVNRLVHEVSRTLEFFEEQRGGERPAQLELLGGVEQLRGFRNFLTQRLEMPIGRVDSDVLNLLDSSDSGQLINWLAGLEGSPITIGKSRYAFRDQRLVKSGAAPKRSTTKSKQKASSVPAKSDAAGGRASRRRAQAVKSEGGFLARLRKPKETADGSDEAKDQTGAYMFVFYAILGAVLYLGWQSYTKVERQRSNQAIVYQQSVTKANALHEQLAKLGISSVAVKTVSNSDDDKVLWAEKFLSLGRQMTPALWLTDVYLDGETQQISDFEVFANRLVIEGAALPSSDGHIAEVARFIERLEQDEAGFMIDFRSISFEGAHVDETEADPVVRFTLAAHYDRNKRVTIKKRKTNSSGDPSDGGGGLEGMQDAIDQHNQTLEELTAVPR